MYIYFCMEGFFFVIKDLQSNGMYVWSPLYEWSAYICIGVSVLKFAWYRNEIRNEIRKCKT